MNFELKSNTLVEINEGQGEVLIATSLEDAEEPTSSGAPSCNK
jgi:hypothetical protein